MGIFNSVLNNTISTTPKIEEKSSEEKENQQSSDIRKINKEIAERNQVYQLIRGKFDFAEKYEHPEHKDYTSPFDRYDNFRALIKGKKIKHNDSDYGKAHFPCLQHGSSNKIQVMIKSQNSEKISVLCTQVDLNNSIFQQYPYWHLFLAKKINDGVMTHFDENKKPIPDNGHLTHPLYKSIIPSAEQLNEHHGNLETLETPEGNMDYFENLANQKVSMLQNDPKYAINRLLATKPINEDMKNCKDGSDCIQSITASFAHNFMDWNIRMCNYSESNDWFVDYQYSSISVIGPVIIHNDWNATVELAKWMQLNNYDRSDKAMDNFWKQLNEAEFCRICKFRLEQYMYNPKFLEIVKIMLNRGHHFDIIKPEHYLATDTGDYVLSIYAFAYLMFEIFIDW